MFARSENTGGNDTGITRSPPAMPNQGQKEKAYGSDGSGFNVKNTAFSLVET